MHRKRTLLSATLLRTYLQPPASGSGDPVERIGTQACGSSSALSQAISRSWIGSRAARRPLGAHGACQPCRLGFACDATIPVLTVFVLKAERNFLMLKMGETMEGFEGLGISEPGMHSHSTLSMRPPKDGGSGLC